MLTEGPRRLELLRGVTGVDGERRRMAGDDRPGALGSQTGCGQVQTKERDVSNALRPSVWVRLD